MCTGRREEGSVLGEKGKKKCVRGAGKKEVCKERREKGSV